MSEDRNIDVVIGEFKARADSLVDEVLAISPGGYQLVHHMNRNNNNRLVFGTVRPGKSIFKKS